MQNPAAPLYCSNPNCQTPNLESHKFCQKCRTPLQKLYLWAVGEGIETYQVETLIAERYLLKNHRILLDTKPALPPQTPEDIPSELQPYLRLSAYQLHIPQVYGRVGLTTGRQNTELWLLEQAAISTGVGTAESGGQLMPELTAVWQNASALRQLNWLWQIAQLWEPLKNYGVASSLLSPALLRVNGSIIRLLMLQLDQKKPATLAQLGELWSQWSATAHPTVANFIQQVATGLIQSLLQTSEQLIALLDWGLQAVGRSQAYSINIVTRTDKGPSRQQNEDACYPEASEDVRVYRFDSNLSSSTNPIAIVCDGIGGHEGGEVASHSAIETIWQSLQHLWANPDNLNPTTLTLALERAACAANDRISQRNDAEQRHERQRMGTTLVMAVTHAHEIYITHVGDSRAYWITHTGGHQVTLDDDIASREVRLGYALYRNAVLQSGSGSLVQALGMGSSTILHPTVQRFILDEDCIFLLCSDGLSDYDRVEQFWETEILPVLEGQTDLATAVVRLVELANTKNGHDNVTVGLVHCQVRATEVNSAELSVPQLNSLPPVSPPPETTVNAAAASSELKTQLIPQKSSSGSLGRLLLAVILFLGLSGVLAYWLIPGFQERVNPPVGQQPSPTPSAAPTTPLPAASSPVPSLRLGALRQTHSSITTNAQGKEVPLVLLQGSAPPQNAVVIGQVPAGSVLQIVKKQVFSNKDSWLNLKVCSLPEGSTNLQKPSSPEVLLPSKQPATPQVPAIANPQLVQPGKAGWILESEVLPVLLENVTPASANLGVCAKAAPSPTPTP